MKGTTYRRCGCKHPDTGKPLNQNCPDLDKRRHGTWTLDTRIDTTDRDQRRLKRGGYETQKAAGAALDHIGDLLKLAGDDTAVSAKIGDLIFERTKRGGELPDVDEIRRRLGAGVELAARSVTVREWLEEWLAGKRRALRESTFDTYRGHLDHYLIPLLGDIPRDKLQSSHVAGIFDTIDEWNAEILAAKEERRPPDLPDDTRVRKKLTANSTHHKILKTLSMAYNVAVKRPGMIDWNPCLAVDLPPVRREPARVWSPEQVVTYLRYTADDRLGPVYRLVLLRGLRRGEVLGIRWDDLDDDLGGASIRQTLLEIRGVIKVGAPKTQAGERWVSLDAGTAAMLKELRARQLREKFAAGAAYSDHGLVFCHEDGTMYRPSTVSWAFRQRAAAANLPVIKFHEGRHTAATLAFEAGLPLKTVSDQLGHSSTAITGDLYTHVRRAMHHTAAEQVMDLLSGENVESKSGGGRPRPSGRT